MKRVWIAVGLVAAALAIVIALRWRASSSEPEPRAAGGDVSANAGSAAAASFVGSQRCAECHAAESAAWRRSQHAAAMARATPDTVLGKFDRTFTHAGITSTFSQRDGHFYVRTDGADGKLADFEVTHTFGVYPLQQYLVPLPGGKLQALSIAWDARPASDGGQRWFHLYPGERITSSDPLHWTGLRQNWNFMCADCHATNLHKGYDPSSRAFATTFSEMGVGCEACHGPGSTHVSGMRNGSSQRPGNLWLTVQLDERRNVTWTLDPASNMPVRSVPRTSARELETCARCHSRRAQLTDRVVAGRPFDDAFRASLLEPALFRPDGQPKEEVYNYAGFLQSRMHAKGVTCSDCHDPHSGSLRAPGNATCTQCHQAARFDTPTHRMHAAGTPAAACATCHMPVSTYMVVDPRHDHSFRVPRPDRTAALGVPNVCTGACHAGKSPAWAADAIRRNTGRDPVGYQSFAEAFAASERGDPTAGGGLTAVVRDAAVPAIVRASAIERLQSQSSVDVTAIVAQLDDPSPLVRRAAVALLARADDATRLMRLVPKLSDAVRTVRSEAVLALMDLADRAISGPDRAAFDRAFDEYVAEQRFNADRPEAQTNLGQALLARGRADEARAAFEEAIRLDRAFVPAYVNLSDVHRTKNDEAAAERVLREGLAIAPRAAVLHHALGLALVRQRRAPDAVPSLARACELDPANPRYQYVYAVALHDTGHAAEATAVLRAAARRWPADRAIAEALSSYTARR